MVRGKMCYHDLNIALDKFLDRVVRVAQVKVF